MTDKTLLIIFSLAWLAGTVLFVMFLVTAVAAYADIVKL